MKRYFVMELKRYRGDHFPLLSCGSYIIVEFFSLKLYVNDFTKQTAGLNGTQLQLIWSNRILTTVLEIFSHFQPWPVDRTVGAARNETILLPAT
ncbi:hypothetical protein D3C76_1204960 [compost metagenome]